LAELFNAFADNTAKPESERLTAFFDPRKSSSMPSFLIVSDTEDFRVLLAQLLAIEWPDVEVEDWEFRSEDKIPAPWPRVDLVLLDCGASHSEGLEWLRGAPASLRRPPIIALTDPEDSEAAAQAVALGAAACLSRRNVSRVRLTAAINAVLQRQIADEASAEAAVDSEKTLLLSELGAEPLASVTIAAARSRRSRGHQDRRLPRNQRTRQRRHVHYLPGESLAGWDNGGLEGAGRKTA